MGATVIGAGILAGSSLLGTGATMLTNKSNRDFSGYQNEQARQWSTNERLAAQEYNTQERLAAQEYNTRERLAVQDYNSIGNQVMQARAAGLNANVVGSGVSFQGSSPQHSTPQSSTAASAPMSGIGTAQVPNIPQLISSGADLINALSKHKETQATLPLINEQVKNYMLQNFGQETSNKILDLEKQLKQSTLPAEIKIKFEELAKLGFDKMVSEQQGKNFEQQYKLLKQQESINELLKGLKGQELIQAQYLTQRWNEIQDSVVAMNKAKASESSASASNYRQQARITSVLADIQEATSREQISAKLSELEKDGALSKTDAEQARQKLESITTLRDGGYRQKLDNFTIWLKDRISIFK